MKTIPTAIPSVCSSSHPFPGIISSSWCNVRWQKSIFHRWHIRHDEGCHV